MTGDPPLLRVPQTFHTVEDVLGTAERMDLPNVLVLSEQENGSLVFLGTEMSLANTLWLLERMKMLLLMPSNFERIGP